MDRIEQEKIRIKNEINNRIREINISLSRIEDSLNNLNKSNLGKDFIEKSKIKNRELKEKLTLELSELENKLYNNNFEVEILDNLNESKIFSDNLNETRNKAKKILDSERAEKFQRSKVNWQAEKNEYHKIKNVEKDMDREYYHFINAIDSLPGYIQKNLKEMPNNKGYIFKGVYHFGNLPAEKGQPYIFFEKNRDGSQLIHEWYPNKRRTFIKNNNGHKTLLKEELRKKIGETGDFGNNLRIKTVKKKDV